MVYFHQRRSLVPLVVPARIIRTPGKAVPVGSVIVPDTVISTGVEKFCAVPLSGLVTASTGFNAICSSPHYFIIDIGA